ncbi:MAG TPA: isoprenylcysteine carboxylmethyltransferase family protein [Chthoniobacterales bacterium]|jgi:protein-S-isoprenylcysteine O-methyltransferase Ste14
MKLPSIFALSLILMASEFLLALTKRSGTSARRKDRMTLPLLWTVIGLSIWTAFYLQAKFPQGAFAHRRSAYLAGLTLFAIGLIVRWAAIIHLGRFFTVNVAIAEDHQLVTTGPYRHVRHPSYTGTFLIFLGYGLCMLNIYSLAAVFLPVVIAFLWRIHIEEEALRGAFGDKYEDYAARTRRVIPFLY